MKLYQDLHIRRDQTLVIPCRLELVEQAKIVVEPGGLLIVDGGVIRNGRYYIEEGFYNKPWRGVEVWGNSAEDQVTPSDFNIWPIENLEHQGMVIMKNSGSIENAEIGVYLGKPGDPTKAGGVLRMESTSAGPFNTIRDCRRAVKLDPYIHHVPLTLGNYTGTMAVSNRSRFAHARFEFTDAFDNIHGQNNPVALIDANGIRGLLIRGRSFTNSRTDATGSIQLGHGALAHNSTIRVTSACPDPNQNCALAVQLPSTFTGLDHAIHATSSPKRGQTVVERSTFTDNVYGVYVNGQAFPRIIGNTFNYGGRVAVFDNPDEFYWEERHRGIFLHRCNGIRVWDNVLSEVAAPLAETEGIVVGYTTTGSETVRNNDCTNIDGAYVGEGISASTTAPASIGLQFLCNLNSANDWNIWSRIAAGDPLPIADQTIRTNQGDQTWAADNFLDNCIGSTWDLKVETLTPVTYWCRTDPHYEPLCIDGNATVNVQPYAPYQNCQLILVPPSNGMALQDEVEAATAAYAALRFLYANLIDGGSTDEVLDEIADAWPQDFWDLRAYLLSRSPYLSVEALKEAMDKPGFPDAMRAEICIANPEATQQQGFILWLQTECIAPLPELLINNIRASWDTRTYRFTLEAQMGHEHARMSEAAYMLMDLVSSDDDEGADVTEEQATMALLRSPEMRYHEAALCMGMGRFTEARTIIESLPDEHDLRGAEVIERGRMLVLIDMLEDVHLDGRTEAQLTPAEIAQFEAFIDVEHDRPTNWVSNLLCYNYGICRSPYTGDAGAEPKALVRRPTKQPLKPMPRLALKPNPANAFVVCTFELLGSDGDAWLILRDAMGREQHKERLSGAQGQALLDTRALQAGAYTVEIRHDGGSTVLAERLIIQP